MLTTVDEYRVKELIRDSLLPLHDYHQRRIVNARDPINPQDYATKNYVVTGVREENLTFTDGYGIQNASINASVALGTSSIEFYTGTTPVLSGKFTGASSATDTNLWLLKDGTLTRVTIASGFLKCV